MRFSGRISGKSCSSFMCPSLYTPMFESRSNASRASASSESDARLHTPLRSQLSTKAAYTNSNGDPHRASTSSVSSSRSLRALGWFSWLTLGASILSYLDALLVRCLASCSGVRSNGNVLGARAAFGVGLRGVGSNDSHQHSLVN